MNANQFITHNIILIQWEKNWIPNNNNDKTIEERERERGDDDYMEKKETRKKRNWMKIEILIMIISMHTNESLVNSVNFM